MRSCNNNIISVQRVMNTIVKTHDHRMYFLLVLCEPSDTSVKYDGNNYNNNNNYIIIITITITLVQNRITKIYNMFLEGVKRIHDVTRDRLPKRFAISDDVRGTLSVLQRLLVDGSGKDEEKTMFLKVLFVKLMYLYV